jgi:hypothetical protein
MEGEPEKSSGNPGKICVRATVWQAVCPPSAYGRLTRQGWGPVRSGIGVHALVFEYLVFRFAHICGHVALLHHCPDIGTMWEYRDIE